MTFQSIEKFPTSLNTADLLAALAQTSGVDPKAVAAVNALLDIARQINGGDASAALASIGAALLASAPPEVAKALDLFQKARDYSALFPGCFGGVGIADHPQYGQLPLDFCSPIPTFMPRGIDPARTSMPARGPRFDDSNRLLRFYSPLKDDQALLIDSFTGTAALSKPFRFTLQLLSENANIPLKELIAKNVTVGIRLADGSQTYVNGYVESFGYDRADGGFAFYEAEVVPWFSLLAKRVNSRIYQNMTVLKVVEEVFTVYQRMANYVFRTVHTYDQETYIVQYDESDEHFVSRLLEKNGLFYYFEHSADGHVMVISDDSYNARFCPPNAAHAEVDFNAGNRAQHDDSVTAFAARRRLHASRVTLNTFDFKSPHGQRIIEGDTVIEQGEVPFLEVYDGSPAFAYKNRAHGDREARRRLEEIEWQGKQFRGESDCRGFVAGHTFKLNQHHWFDEGDHGDNDFLLVGLEVEARNNYFGKGRAAVYRNKFVAIRRKIPYRPQLAHKPPRMAGPHTAIVVGHQGAETHVDQFGRVKVQFHWDRYGKHDESSSCWIRVSQPLAGQGYGMIALPRVGQEVIVAFLDGNCDRPLVTGRVYNADQPVPYALPEGAYITGLRSRSTPGGGGFNELALHDAKGKELVSIHAHKDMFTSVGDSQMTVVNGSDQTVHVTQGAQFTLVSKNIQTTSEEGAIYLNAHTELTLGVGLSEMRFRPDGIIEVQGKMVNTVVNLPGRDAAPAIRSSSNTANEVIDLGDGRFKLPSGRIVRPRVDASNLSTVGKSSAATLSGSDGRLLTNVLNQGVYADEVGQVFHGLARHTRHVAPVPDWMMPADGHPITYTFDSAGEPFWNLGGGKLAGIPPPFARPRLADLQTAALWDGFTDGVEEMPASLATGMSGMVHGRVSVDQVAAGLYQNSPVGWLAAMKDDDAYAAGHRAVGATTGLALGYGMQAGVGATVRAYGNVLNKVDELTPNVNLGAFPTELSRGGAVALDIGAAEANSAGSLGANSAGTISTSASELRAIAAGAAELNGKQAAVLSQLEGFGSRTIISKKSFGQKDLAALSAATGDEFAMFSTGGRRLVIRGDATGVPIGVADGSAQALAAQGWRWSSHVHPDGSLMSSIGDRAVLSAFPNARSTVLDPFGGRGLFNPNGDLIGSGWLPH